MIRFLTSCLATCLCFPPAALLAHHSGAQYDMAKTMTMNAAVTDFIWTNPHVVLMVMSEAKKDQPSQEWRLELTGPGRLTRSGFTKRTFKPGDRIRRGLQPDAERFARSMAQESNDVRRNRFRLPVRNGSARTTKFAVARRLHRPDALLLYAPVNDRCVRFLAGASASRGRKDAQGQHSQIT